MTLYTYDDPALGYNEICFFYEGDYDPNCGGTNFYNDPSLGYDERCYFYNGPGYDAICLAEPIPVVVTPGLVGRYGFSGSRKKEQVKKYLPWLDISIDACLKEVNFETITCEAETLRFKGENPEVSIQINGALFDSRFPSVRGNLIRTTESIQTSANLIEVSSEAFLVSTQMLDAKPLNAIKVQVEQVKTTGSQAMVIEVKNSSADTEGSLIEVSAILIKSGTNNDDQ